MAALLPVLVADLNEASARDFLEEVARENEEAWVPLVSAPMDTFESFGMEGNISFKTSRVTLMILFGRFSPESAISSTLPTRTPFNRTGAFFSKPPLVSR